MNSSPPDDLEKFVQRTLRSLPDRSAPASLEQRVMTGISARKAPYDQPSTSIRAVFVLLSIVAGLALFSLFWLPWPTWLPGGLAVTADRLAFVRNTAGDVIGAVIRSIPTLWCYGVLGAIGILYSAVFGLGATAYRVLSGQRE